MNKAQVLYQNRPATFRVTLKLRNGGGVYPLPGVYAVNLYRHNNTVPFAVATVANTKLTLNVGAGTFDVAHPAGDMLGIEGYGSGEIIRTDAGNQVIASWPCRFVKEGTPFIDAFSADLVVYQNDLIILLEMPELGTQPPIQFMDEGLNLGSPGDVIAMNFTGQGFTATYSLGVVTLAFSALASLITNVPAGGIAATNVQAAINELDTEKFDKAGGTITGNVTVSGNLVVNGATYTVNATTVTYDDILLVIGGDTAPVADDAKDRGIEFRWHNGSVAKLGFFGWDRSTQEFTFIPDATDTADVISGTVGTIRASLNGNATTASAWATGRTITTTGDVAGVSAAWNGAANISFALTIANDAVTNAKLANMAANSVKLNNTGAPADPIDGTMTQLLDMISSTRGAILYRGAGGWLALPPNTAGYFLRDGGAGADPTFVALTGGGDMLAANNLSDLVNKATSRINLDVDQAELFKVLAADDAGANVNTAQPWFPTAGAVDVEANTTYFFEGLLWLSRAAGVTSHTTALLFGGTATLTSIMYAALPGTGQVATIASADIAVSSVATALNIKAASTTATEQIKVFVKGTVRINAVGTFIPQFQYSAAPGGAPTVKADSYFRMQKIGSGAVASKGTWT